MAVHLTAEAIQHQRRWPLRFYLVPTNFPLEYGLKHYC